MSLKDFVKEEFGIEIKSNNIIFTKEFPAMHDATKKAYFMVGRINEKEVKDIKFEGHGCAISQAATSMLTDGIKGKTLEEIKKISREDVVNMLGIEIGLVRTKCAVLGLVAVKEGIKKYHGKIQG